MSTQKALVMQSPWALTVTKARSRRPIGATVIQRFHYYVLVMIIITYFGLSYPVLSGLGWHYLGGGGEIEKIHPATYLLLVGFLISLMIDQTFRSRVVGRTAADPSLVLFVLAVTVTAAYTCVVQGASVAPFVDTFLVAILATIIVTCIPVRPLRFLRRLIDVFFVVNILLIFLEAMLHRSFFATYPSGVSPTSEAAATFDRASGFFGNALDAGMLLGVYSVANVVSMPERFSKAGIARLFLSLLSYLAIFPTGSRAAMVVTTIVLVLYASYSIVVSGVRGYVSKGGLIVLLCTGLLLIPLCMSLWGGGFFDSMSDRIQYDNGSAESRDYALNILAEASASDLWFGRPVSDILALQRSFGLIAIEISWANFILVGGLITAIPLFITFVLFLFRSIRLYCRAEIYFISLVIIVVTATSNGIWSKTTALTISLVVAISFLRRNVEPSRALARGRALSAPSISPFVPMIETTPSPLGQVIAIGDERIKNHLDPMVRGSAEETLNALVDAEADRLWNAGRYERSKARRDTRARHYEPKLQTKAGEVKLRIPKLRAQTFELAIIERYRRRESSVEEALIEIYLAKVSVYRIGDITQALWGTRVSPSTVSELNKKIYGTIEAWRDRPIEGEHPYVYLDGIVLKHKWAGEVRKVSLLMAIGVNGEGYREILGICEGAKEDKAGWSAFLKHLKGRGLHGVRLIISDACMGLAESAAEFFPDAVWQRCIVDWYRNIHLPSTKVREITAMLKAIHAGEDIVAARQKAVQVIKTLRGLRLTNAAEFVAATVEETLAYYAFPEKHWRRIRTNNPLEGILREIRRRPRVVGAFPDSQSALNLAAARLRHIAGTSWSTKRYLNIELLKDQQMRGAMASIYFTNR